MLHWERVQSHIRNHREIVLRLIGDVCLGLGLRSVNMWVIHLSSLMSFVEHLLWHKALTWMLWKKKFLQWVFGNLTLWGSQKSNLLEAQQDSLLEGFGHMVIKLQLRTPWCWTLPPLKVHLLSQGSHCAGFSCVLSPTHLPVPGRGCSRCKDGCVCSS